MQYHQSKICGSISTKNKTSKVTITNKTKIKPNGFTLIELMITISIAGIAMAIALPNLSEFIVQMRVDNRVSELQRLILTTRNTAINTGQNASLCILPEDPAVVAECQENSNDWGGRIGVISHDGAGVAGGEALIREREAIKDNDELQFAFNQVTFGPDGQLTTNNALFSYCPYGHADYSRGVDMSLSGRAYLTSDINGDGIDQDRAGNNVVCN